MSASIEQLGVFGLRILQPDGVEKFGTDAILLADFAARLLRPSSRVTDLCTGSGIIALLLAARSPAYTAAVEIDPRAAAAAEKNASINNLPIEVVCADIRSNPLPAGSMDLITCNPPYYTETSQVSPVITRRMARSDYSCSFSDAAKAASRLLRFGGTFCAVYWPERLTDAICAMRAASLEPKCLRLVAHDEAKPPFAVLLEGKKGAHPGLKIMPLLMMQSAEAAEIYAGRYDKKENHEY